MAKKRRKKKYNKGGPFERAVAKQLSLWWSGNTREDLCWRTSGSGARATVRGRKGKQTAGHSGDLCATDESMAPFFRLFAVELKRGYHANATLQDLLDTPEFAKKRTFEDFITQAVASMVNAGTPFWMLVVKRDQKEPLVLVPTSIFRKLKIASEDGPRTRPFASVSFETRGKGPVSRSVVFRLEHFLRDVSPDELMGVYHAMKLGGTTRMKHKFVSIK